MPRSRSLTIIHPIITVLLTVGTISAAATVPSPVRETLPGDAPGRFKIYIEEDGVYVVTFEDLVQAGLGSPVPTRSVGMTSRGEDVPLWIEDGGDGSFGPGDRMLFVGRRLHGEYSYLDEYSRFNCYFVDLHAAEPSRGFTTTARPASTAKIEPGTFVVSRHFEEDTVMVRYPERPDQPQERWYWSRLSVTDREPFRISLDLEGIEHSAPTPTITALDLRNLSVVGGTGEDLAERLDEIFRASGDGTTAVKLRIGLRGWSKPRDPEGLPHHAISVMADGKDVGGGYWNGTEHFVDEIEIPLTGSDRLELEIRVPRRKLPESGDLFVDVVLLNWIEIEYPRRAAFPEGQSRFGIQTGSNAEIPHFTVDAAAAGSIFLSSDLRVEVQPGPNGIDTPDDLKGPFFAVLGDAFRTPDHVVADRPSNLRDGPQTDYIVITHRRLIDAVEPLAEFHRKQGLTVRVIDVEDIYDEFNWGIENPKSLHDFLDRAYHHWPEPRPRFVLLAGDASWDFKNLTADDSRYADWTYRPGEARQFVKNSSSPYETGAGLNNRNLVPTWSYRTSQGHAASDNWLVCVDGDDIYPDMAIGRIPVVDPEDLESVIAKTIAYAREAPPGPWRKNILFITNESKGFQRASDSTAEIYERRGYRTLKIYPQPEEKANEAHSRAIVDAFDEGLLLVQFLGHGGRYIWRTGPPDLKKNHDLFTLEHLDTLAPTEKIPFVISLTCYSAPFDHPTADSIGEKLLRLKIGGAIGVFAASWRNSPSSNMGRLVMDELTRPGATIGEAIMRAKGKLRSPTLIETYNLLGDPAVSLAVAPDVEPPEDESDPAAVRQSSDAARKPPTPPASSSGSSAPKDHEVKDADTN